MTRSCLEAVVGPYCRKQRDRKAYLPDSFQWQPTEKRQFVCNPRTWLVVVVSAARNIVYKFAKAVDLSEDAEYLIRSCD